MQLIQQLSMRNKLLLLVVPSLLAVLYFSIASVLENVSEARESRQLYQQANFTLALDPVIEALQRERGLSAVAIAAGLSTDATQNLRQQRTQTDTAIGQLMDEISRLEHSTALSSDMHELLRSYQALSGNLRQWRRQIDDRQLSRQAMLERFTSVIGELTAFAPLVIRSSNEAELANLLTAYYLLTDAAEMAGRERATGAVLLGLQTFDLGLFQQLSVLVGSQQGSLDKAHQLIGGELAERIERLNQHRDSQAAVRAREQLLNAGEAGIELSSAQWFEQTTARINVIYGINQAIIERVTAQADHIADQARNELIAVGIVATLLIGFVLFSTFLIMRAIHAQVSSLLSTIDYAMQHKDLRGRVDVRSDDELGRIGNAINALFGSFAQALKRIDQTSVQLATATEETSSTATQNTDQTARQQRQVEQVATATEEMTTTSEDISRNTQQVAHAADNATISKDKGLAAVRESATSVDTLVNSVHQVGEVIRQLEERSGSINNVITVIKNVAEQTNLLALNAAIEAARAGEHGRGFAVVADEVRKLASQTHSSTNEIEAMLSAFQSLTGNAYSSINESQSVAEATKEQVGELKAAFDAIDRDVSEISSMASQIATAAEQQVAVTRDIAQNMESVTEASLLTLTGSQEITAVTEEQAKLARNLQDLAIQFKTDDNS